MEHNMPKTATPIASLALALLSLLAAVPNPADAATVAFSGTRSNVTPIVGAPGGRCGGAITVGFSPENLSASGSSNLGSFDVTGSHCIAGFPPGPYSDGVFEWAFAGGTLFGTYDGLLTVSATPGIFDFFETILFTGGTGKFLDAYGSATVMGTLGFGEVGGIRVTIGEATFDGELNAPAIPEASTWAMMIVGFGLVGGLVRRRNAALASVSGEAAVCGCS